jgi:hypothetical protein
MGEPSQAAHGFQHGLLEHQVLTLGKAEAKLICKQLPARLVSIEKGALNGGPETSGRISHRWRAHEPTIEIPGIEHFAQVRPRKQHVRINQDDVITLRRPPAFNAIVQLWILADPIVSYQQPCTDMGIDGNEAADNFHCRITDPRGTEDDFAIARAEFKSAFQCFKKILIVARYWTNNGHIRQRHVMSQGHTAVGAKNDYDCRQDMQHSRGHEKCKEAEVNCIGRDHESAFDSHFVDAHVICVTMQHQG